MRRPLAVVDRRLLSECIAEQAHLTGVPIIVAGVRRD